MKIDDYLLQIKIFCIIVLYSLYLTDMPHKVEISDKTYGDLREFCRLNDLKIGQYADKLIHDGLMIEMYGDVPFTDYRRPPEIESVPVPDYSLAVPKEEVGAVAMDPPSGLPVGGVFGAIDKGTKDRVIEEMEKIETGHPQTYITSQEGEKEIRKEMLRQVGTISASDIEDYVSEMKKMQEAALEHARVPAKVINKITRRRLK